MLVPLRTLIEGHNAPLTVAYSGTIRHALSLMIEHDYSQLPVCNTAGRLTGIISEQSIVHRLAAVGGFLGFLDLAVDHAHEPAVTMAPGDDLFDALVRLKAASAIVVVEDGNPVGIVTHADTTDFFRQVSEGLILIEDIETTLREQITRAFPDPASWDAAARATLRPPAEQSNRPPPAVDALTLNEEIEIIRNRKNWPVFKDAFESLEMFSNLMNSVRGIRNQLMHFRGGLQPAQRMTLTHASWWLNMRPLRPASQQSEPDAEDDPEIEAATPVDDTLPQSTLAAVQARQKQIAKAGGRGAGRQWDEGQFMADLGVRGGAEQVVAARRILEWAKPLHIWYGKGKSDGSFFPMLEHGGTSYWSFSVWSYGRMEIQFQNMKNKPPFDRLDMRSELARRLSALHGIPKIGLDGLSKRPTFPLSVLTDPATLEAFLCTFDWYLDTIRAYAP